MIKLKLHKMCKLHTKSPKNSINKENILIRRDRIARYYPQYGICLIKPTIDKLIMAYDFKEFNEDIRDELIEYNTSSFPQNLINDETYKSVPLWLHNKPMYRAYKYNGYLKFGDCDDAILIQAVPKNSKRPFMRIQLNPEKLGKKGVEFFKDKFNEDFSLPDAQVRFENIAKQHNAIIRMDVAYDILGLNVGDMFLRMVKGGKICQSKSQLINGLVGRNETIYPNYKKQTSNDVCAYNKKQELLENGCEPAFDEASHTRFERRINKTQHSLNDAHKLQNHLKKVDVRAIDYESFNQKHFSHKQFMQIVRDRGLDKALNNIPANDHENFMDTYNTGLVNIWEPEYLWKQLPEALKSYGLVVDG